MHKNVVVIGSGLSALGAVKALISKGIYPILIDPGLKIDNYRAEIKSNLSKKMPDQWEELDKSFFDIGSSLNAESAIPKKLLFGSDYFYGKSNVNLPIISVGNPPPYSYALGGFSAGWGAAVLPPQRPDLIDWPIDSKELEDYCKRVIDGLPYSACEDGLSLNFPILKNSSALTLSKAESFLLEKFSRAKILKMDDIIFGQARLLVRPKDSERDIGCRYCGRCMSGCVYDSIYKAEHDICNLIDAGQLRYLSGLTVQKILQGNNGIKVECIDSNGIISEKIFDRVFLAAGAVNSTRIVLNSLSKFNHEVKLKTRGGFVMPIFSFEKIPMSWPNCNTQPGIFLEVRGKLLKHWTHIQISLENELLIQKLELSHPSNSFGFILKFKKFISQHVFLAFINFHSDDAGYYKLLIKEPLKPGKAATLHTTHIKKFPKISSLVILGVKLLNTFSKIGCLPLFLFAKLNSGAYHVGGTLPMRYNPSGDLETDTLGRIAAWNQVHIVDTAVFPSLPGTTIGLLAMANAYRIVDSIDWDDAKDENDQI